MKTIEKAYNQFYGTKQQQPVQSIFDIVYDKPDNIDKIKAALNAPEHMVNILKINEFKEAVSRFREYTQHLIFMEM